MSSRLKGSSGPTEIRFVKFYYFLCLHYCICKFISERGVGISKTLVEGFAFLSDSTVEHMPYICEYCDTSQTFQLVTVLFEWFYLFLDLLYLHTQSINKKTVFFKTMQIR